MAGRGGTRAPFEPSSLHRSPEAPRCSRVRCSVSLLETNSRPSVKLSVVHQYFNTASCTIAAAIGRRIPTTATPNRLQPRAIEYAISGNIGIAYLA